MTSHPSVGLSRPHTRAPSRTASQTQLSFNGTPSRHVLFDLTDVARPSSDGETPSKRRKIENDARTFRAGLGNLQHDGSADNFWQASRPGGTPQPTNQQGQAHFQSPTVPLSLAKTNAMGDEAPVEPQPLPPLPMRPGSLASARSYRQQRMTVYCGASRREGVQVKPYVLDPPPFAPHFERDKVADFFPWMGNHPEDVLSEHVASKGFYDKTQISHESNTARPSIYSIFKHKSGLHTLSTLFVSALEQRQAHGRVTAGSTFKPPPRVTLTDTKREAWLKDLANPAVPLRRLSRTIPHGIRGKVLLDQCLSKDIPTTRAVWLAKCVGANEIRAFKRKGTSGTFAMGGEAKWVRDWTTCVEQFIDGVIASCGTTDWRSKMTYAIRLSANLYSEHLLDREHYLDSVLTSFESATLDTIPIWTLVLQIVWKDLVEYRKYGRRLVEALLEKINVPSQSEDTGLFTPIVQRLSVLTRDLLNTSPACFIIPRRWAEFEATLGSCLDPQHQSLIARFERLRQRNRQLIEVGRLHKSDLGQSPREQLIRNLDCLRAPFDVSKVSEMCLEMVQSHDTAIAILFQWISTPYREGEAHVYLTVRLLRQWNKLGYDTDKPILNYLATSRNSLGLRKHNLYQVVVELVRSRQFSVGKYCQWLLARGALSGYDGLNKNDPCDVRLLAELPLYSLSEYSVNLRTMLLNGASFSTDDESTLIQNVKDQIRAQCLGLFEPATQRDSNVKRVEKIELCNLSWTVKSDISRWLRQVVASRVQNGDPHAMSDWKDVSSPKQKSVITVEQLCFARSILEGFRDYSILADVLNLASSSNDQELLASVADTVNYHFDIFSAIGAASDLFKRLTEQNRAVTAARPPCKALLVSLIDLGAHFPTRSETVQQLCGQLALCEQKSAVAACSPVSDHIAEALQSAESNFTDEFEQLLTSGTSMDKQTMTRLFSTVMKRIENSWEHSGDESYNLGILCSRLRIFDSKHFDSLMLVWVESLLLSTSRPELNRALLPLVSAGCLSLRAAVVCARMLIEGTEQKEARDDVARVVVDMLELIAPLDDARPDIMNQATYRFRLEQRRFSIARPLDTIFIISKAFELGSTSGNGGTKLKLESLLTSGSVMSRLRCLVVHHAVAVQNEFFPATKQIPQAAAVAIERVIDCLLDPSHRIGLTELGLEEQLKRLIQMVDEFSLPFCQLKLRQLLTLEKKQTSASEDHAQGHIGIALFEGAKTAVASKNITWPILLSVIDDGNAGQIRERAEEHLFSSILAISAAQPHDDEILAQSKLAGETYLSIVQALAYTIPESGAPQIGQILADKMSALAQSLSNHPSPINSRHSSQLAPNQHNQQLDYNCFWLNILLRLTLLHHHPSKTTTPPTNLLLTLSTLLLSPSLRTNPPLLQSLFDTTSTLIDHLPPTARTQCIRSLESKLPSRTDPRLRFLFGYGGRASDDDVGSGAGGGAGGGNGGEGSALRIEGKGGKVLGALNLKAWEVIQDPAPMVGENDTFLSLALFRARKVVV